MSHLSRPCCLVPLCNFWVGKPVNRTDQSALNPAEIEALIADMEQHYDSAVYVNQGTKDMWNTVTDGVLALLTRSAEEKREDSFGVTTYHIDDAFRTDTLPPRSDSNPSLALRTPFGPTQKSG